MTQTWTEIGNNVDFDNVVIQKAVPIQLCPQIMKQCTGDSQQYSSVATCVAELEVKPFGSFDEAWGDNVVCREIHVLLTKVRPGKFPRKREGIPSSVITPMKHS